MLTGLLGEKLGHSYSPAIHAMLGNDNYQLFEVAPDDLATFLSRPDLDALNVTIPYKEAVRPYLAEESPAARAIGAVNSLVRNADGRWMGHNTDFDGLAYLLDALAGDVAGKKCLILGGGGTAKTAHAVLADRGAGEILHIVRHDGISYADLPAHRDARWIINTTPVGMYPQAPAGLVHPADFPQLEGVLDVIYNPLRTALVYEAQRLGIPALGGLAMLVAQAVYAHGYFTGQAPLVDQVATIYQRLRAERENIILIGMPGVGKTSLGQALAADLGRPFVDLDAAFAQAHGPAGDYIRSHGEAAFRRLETDLARQVGQESGQVIACGGGIVTRSENDLLLRQNGRVYHLTRPLADLATDDRPLSQGGRALDRLWANRQALYEAFADRTLSCTDFTAALTAIKEDFFADTRFERP
ncbi:shikimate kinase [Peptococcus simiae]|uniref:Shikimate kinase n=1 Tax=Peptococcus simiae TaxID=1643805 RepID=A0ABW9GZD9_9FIRM